MAKLSIFSRGFPLQQVDLKNDPPTYPPTKTNPDEVLRSRACLVPRRLSLDENVRAKEGGKETTGE